MLMKPTSFHFENRELQRELCARIKVLDIEAAEQPDGTLTFTQEQWGNVNREAHKIRDQRFGLWHFLNFSPEEYLRRQIDLMRTHKIPHELGCCNTGHPAGVWPVQRRGRCYKQATPLGFFFATHLRTEAHICVQATPDYACVSFLSQWPGAPDPGRWAA